MKSQTRRALRIVAIIYFLMGVLFLLLSSAPEKPTDLLLAAIAAAIISTFKAVE